MSTEPRFRLAFLMWCWSEGYENPIDRQGMTNWLLLPDDELHPDDIALRPHLLTMADEILAALVPADE